MIDLAKLSAPFPPSAISWRVGATNTDKTKGLALAYIDARDVMNRLDEVCGAANWQDEYTETATGRVMCRIGIRCEDGWVWKGDGAGDSDVEAAKGAISDALKRAGVKWGIGRYLYDMPATWVAIEQRGKTSIIKDSEYAKLERVAGGTTKRPVVSDDGPDAATLIAQFQDLPTEQALKAWGGEYKAVIESLSNEDIRRVSEAYKAKLASFKTAKIAAE
jgi:Rad52/22 family double-strand break repair protein